jgi:hypothetical protein
MNAKYPKVSIIILNWNGKKLTDECLSSLFRLTEYPKNKVKVIVVDNGSTDDSVEFLKRRYKKRVDIISLKENLGFPKGNNVGMKYALKKYDPKYVVLLNNDTKIIQKDWLKNMIDVAENDEKIGIVGCKLLYPDKRIQYAGISRKRFGDKIGGYDCVKETFGTSGAVFLVKKSLIEKIGGLDEIYTPFLGEEQDYYFRTRRAGFKIFYCGKAKIIHRGGVSLGKVDALDRFYVATKNDLILHFRYYPLSIKFLELVKCVIRTFLTKKRQGKFNINNIKFQKNFLSRFFVFIKALKTALITYKYHFTEV